VSKHRHYRDRCGVARALDLVGDRWALLVIRELLLGPKRFTDLRAGLPRIQPDVLSTRLRELEQHGIVEPEPLPPPASTRAYELTSRGRELEPVILALGQWGSAVPFDATMVAYGPDSAALALKTLFSPARAGALDAVVELRLGVQRFVATVRDRTLEVVRGSAATPAVVLDTDPPTLAALCWHGLSIDDAIATQRLRLDGSRRTARTFLRLFPQERPAA
jgi:DNA-binding HxlR family transcriptional regulator